MTTNQTIDGVPRELVEWMANSGELLELLGMCSGQVRALLVAPAATGRQEPKGAILRFREYVGKGQGGRDLWHDWTEWSTGTVEYAKSKLDQVKDLTNVQFEVEWLYAEQPAPVAAMLAEAREWLGDGQYSDGLHREHWTPKYADLIDRIDAILRK